MADERIRIVEQEGAERIDVMIDGAAFTSYIYPATIMKPVLYPLRTARGTLVTRGFPLAPRPGEREDHPHHVGLWFNYGNVNGLDFWNNSLAVAPEQRDRSGTIRHRQVNELKSGDEQGELAVTMDWLKPDGQAILREDTRFIFRASETSRTIDRLATLTALDVDVSFADDKEGMLGIRVARELEQPGPDAGEAGPEPNGRYRSRAGLEGDAVWGTRADWVKLAGKIGPETVSLVIIDHPENPGYPTYWHARGYGLFAANPLGQKPLSGGKDELNFALPAGSSVAFKYRIVIESRDELTDDLINREFAAFAGEC